MGNYFWGVDYYPEHWPEERWETDCVLMEELGIQFVRMAEFAWAKMEPSEGDFHFEWLDKIISMLASHGIKTVLGTPTAAPPAWIIHKNREILPVDRDGIRCEFGGRHHDCQSNEVYRAHIRRFVTAMADHFKDNENVIGWQVDNELGNSHDNLCFCDSCADKFRAWLKNKYGTVDELNSRTGGAFWSQEYSSFDEIQPPRHTVAGHNPSIVLDWTRFHSDLICDFHKMQADIIRKYCPDKFITHNCMGFANVVSYFDLSKDLDFISHDQYPGGYFQPGMEQSHWRLAAELDFIRSIKKKPFWIMEQQSSITGWERMGNLPDPGKIPLWSLHSIAHGADAVCWFRWRSCVFGTEQFWHGILPHSGVPGRAYKEIQSFIKDVGPYMEELQGTMPVVEAAIVYSYDQLHAFDNQPGAERLNYLDNLLIYYRTLYEMGIPVDFIRETEDFSKYKLVVAPLQYLMNEDKEKRFTDYVEGGGSLILTMRTGVKNDDNVCMCDKPLPGNLSSLLGITVPEYNPGSDGMVEYIGLEGTNLWGCRWNDLIECNGAEVLAKYAYHFYEGTPAITANKYGKGTAYYVGVVPDRELSEFFMKDVVKKAGIEIRYEPSMLDEVEVSIRENDKKKFYFVMNHSFEPGCKEIPDFGKVELKPYEFRIFVKEK